MMLSFTKLVALATVLLLPEAVHGQEQNAQIPLGSASPRAGSRPNILFILTDDQDLHMNSLDYMPLVKKHLLDQGTLYKRHYTTTAVCCPARVSIFTGKAAHNTNVTDLTPPYGKSII
jgi:arylsulfatase A-like enzyme